MGLIEIVRLKELQKSYKAKKMPLKPTIYKGLLKGK